MFVKTKGSIFFVPKNYNFLQYTSEINICIWIIQIKSTYSFIF